MAGHRRAGLGVRLSKLLRGDGIALDAPDGDFGRQTLDPGWHSTLSTMTINVSQ